MRAIVVFLFIFFSLVRSFAANSVGPDAVQAALKKSVSSILEMDENSIDSMQGWTNQDWYYLASHLSQYRGQRVLTAKLAEIYGIAGIRRSFSAFPNIQILSGEELFSIQAKEQQTSLVDGLIYMIEGDRLKVLGMLEVKLSERVRRKQIQGFHRRFCSGVGLNVLDSKGNILKFNSESIDFLQDARKIRIENEALKLSAQEMNQTLLQNILKESKNVLEYPLEDFRMDLFRVVFPNLSMSPLVTERHPGRVVNMPFAKEHFPAIAQGMLRELFGINQNREVNTSAKIQISSMRVDYYTRLGVFFLKWLTRFESSPNRAHWPHRQTQDNKEKSLYESFSQFSGRAEALTRMFTKEQRADLLHKFPKLLPKESEMCQSLFLSGAVLEVVEEEVKSLYRRP